MKQRITLAALATLLSLNAAHAHQIWIEPDGQGAKLFFGEFGDNLREVSPGLLDKFVKPQALRLSAQGAQPLEINKTASGFALAGRPAAGESVVAEDPAYPLSVRKDGDKAVRSIYVPAARLVADFSPQLPRLTLDLVPTGQHGAAGVQLQASYQGKPLPKAKVALVTASGWMQEHRTDEAGLITVQLPWSGPYVLELSHQDATAGQRGAESYDRASYVTSLTLLQSAGLAPLPAVPAATPNKLN